MRKPKIVGEIKEKIGSMGNIFCSGIKCRKNMKRDVLIISMVTLVALAMMGIVKYGYLKKEWKERELMAKADSLVKGHVDGEFESQVAADVKSIQDSVNTENWKEYQTKWYGFKIKYPNEWKQPIAGVSVGNSGAEYRYGFRKTNVSEDKYIGFDVAVYSISKTKELTNTGEYPSLKDGITIADSGCETINGHLIETGNYSAEEIYMPMSDNCYNPVLFFSVTQGQYIYNMVPVLRERADFSGDPMIEVADNLPEFFAAISFFENIEIVRPKVVPKPVIKAPMPVAFKRVGGRLVCDKKDDKPGKSKQNKKKHMDMECCLDPDEYPNPHCYYDPGKYGKYLK